ncbi:hypothetical protein GCM10022198_06110 [Klugiella xanthotipulae]|uniref:PadR family transcriptional regulator n=1 Tax=Klugiella xanthotipulae TaxID=244735 RepID=A0A543HS52_9MICO|nr:helix-turn-helix transcriptional regulator [Klugiella xanthotipulae]TQM61135.1 PadR family transcriptional regulator [Klugiella xanthotipulae]
MSIKNGILALLTLGPAYGLQLRNELQARTLREPALNVGQVYSTLERLQSSGLVKQTAETDDRLPLYTLTDTGAASAASWITTGTLATASPWESMVFQVLLVRSLPGVDSTPLLVSLRDQWVRINEIAQESYRAEITHDLRSHAGETLSIAALSWLRRVGDTSDHGMPLDTRRPQRGRPSTRALAL